MAGVIVPSAKPLMLCEEIDTEGGMVNVYGLFNAIRPESFPYHQPVFSVFAQLSGGLGEVLLVFDIRRASDGRLVHTTARRVLRFSRRTQLLQVSMTSRQILFETAGMYLVELLCDNTWVADVTLDVSEDEP